MRFRPRRARAGVPRGGRVERHTGLLLGLTGFALDPALGFLPVPASLRAALLAAGVKTGRNNRCPGALERTAPDGSNPFVPADFNCDRSQVPIGP